jgi:hypothetical protein
VPRLLWLCLLFWWPLAALAAEIEIASPQLSANDEGYVLSADFAFELGPRLEEAVTRGVSLHFVAEFELTRPRWYWLDEKLVSRSQTWRLSYNALTRQYRLANGGGLHQSFASLSEALRMLSRLRNWLVIDKAQAGSERSLRPGDPYLAALRLRLDITQLPRPFQISALGNREWNLASDWRFWQQTLPPALPAWSEPR